MRWVGLGWTSPVDEDIVHSESHQKGQKLVLDESACFASILASIAFNQCTRSIKYGRVIGGSQIPVIH